MQKVLILLSTFNGEKYLSQLLESILNQEKSNFSINILVRDDGSQDQTIKILKKYTKILNLDYYIGKNIGPASSFMDLVKNCAISFDYYLFCDQDDIWMEKKISSAIEKMENMNNKPCLYYCGADIVDENLNSIGGYFRDNRFTKSLIYSLITGSLIPGCTMCFNRNLIAKAKQYIPSKIGMHDSWMHLICLLYNGFVIGDENKYILYRQHGNNVVGAGKSSRFKRLKRLVFCKNIYSNTYNQLLKVDVNHNAKNRRIIEMFVDYKLDFSKKKALLKIKNKFLSKKEKLNFSLKIIFNLF